MPKKTTTARGGAQRSKPRKNIELVRPVSEQKEVEAESTVEPVMQTAPTKVEEPPVAKRKAESVRRTVPAIPEKAEEASVTKSKVDEPTSLGTPMKVEEPPIAKSAQSLSSVGPKGSASARLAARRQAAQRTQQRSSAPLISAENYDYVRNDLKFIAILAVLMFATIIILHFVPGIGS
jgi:hypothetical protein